MERTPEAFGREDANDKRSETLDAFSVFRYDMMLYEAAIEIMKAKLGVLQEEFLCLTERSPIDHITARIKSPESIIEKMRRKGYPMTQESVRENIRDIAGVRIVCPFLSDVYAVEGILLRQTDLHADEIRDYIKNPKPGGYRSLHMLVTVEVPLSAGVRKVPVELQLRTIAMNCWAGVEHQLRYKKNVDSAVMNETLHKISRLMLEADESLQALVDDIPGMKDDFGVLTGVTPRRVGE